MGMGNAGFGIVVLTILGWWIDQKLTTVWMFTVIGLILGIVYLAYEIWKLTRK